MKNTGTNLKVSEKDLKKAAASAGKALGKMEKKQRQRVIVASVIILFALVAALFFAAKAGVFDYAPGSGVKASIDVSSLYGEIDALPEFDGKTPYITVNGNTPLFEEEDLSSARPFEIYSELDSLGRCGAAYANICKELMPTDKREDISSVKPSGWVQAKYDFVSGGSLYNRCHLIAFQLAGENANKKNLITGTNYMNHDGMIPFENMVADYVKETGGHVLYRVTPIFKESELVARGVLMEAYSVEDGGESVCYFVYCYNAEPGVEIDYLTGESRAANIDTTNTSADEGKMTEYVLNTKNNKFHLPSCSSVTGMNPENRESFFGLREELIEMGYAPCGACKP